MKKPKLEPKFLTTQAAADRVGLAAVTLRRMRYQGRGPKWHRPGDRVVLYSIADLDAWAAGIKTALGDSPHATA